MIARVLVAIDSADDLPLVDRACEIADEHHAPLEIVGGIARASFTVCLVACPRALNQELESYSRAVLAEAVDRVPPHIPVVWRQVRGCARREALHRAGADDRCLVLVGRLPWWARGALRRRLSRLVLLPDAATTGAPEPPVRLRERAGTLA
jgi:hypothetical protein